MLGKCSEGARGWGDVGPWGSWASQSGVLGSGESGREGLGWALLIRIQDPHVTPSPTSSPLEGEMGSGWSLGTSP